VVDSTKTHILCPVTLFRRKWKNIVESGRLQMTKWLIHTASEYQRLQTYAQDVFYVLLFHGSSDCTNTLQCYVLPILPVFLTHLVYVIRYLSQNTYIYIYIYIYIAFRETNSTAEITVI